VETLKCTFTQTAVMPWQVLSVYLSVCDDRLTRKPCSRKENCTMPL